METMNAYTTLNHSRRNTLRAQGQLFGASSSDHAA
jgi:hypothetical protein